MPSCCSGPGCYIKPECVGAVGDGVVDDTVAMQAWADKIGGGVNGRLCGNYLISGQINLYNKTDFVIEGGGSVKMAGATDVNELFSIFIFFNCHGWKLRDISVDGNRDNREPKEASGHLIRIGESSEFELNNVRADNGTTDGFYLFSHHEDDFGTHCRDFRIVNCHANNNFRQGMSIIQGHDFEVVGGSYTNTNGTAPEAGIDLEPDAQDPQHSITNAKLINILFEGNAGFGLDVAAKKEALQVLVSDCVFTRNTKGAINWGALTGVISGPIIDGVDVLAVRGIIDIKAGSVPRTGYLHVVQPKFKNVSAIDEDHPLIYEHSAANPVTVVDSIEVDYSTVTDTFVILRGAGSFLANPGSVKAASVS